MTIAGEMELPGRFGELCDELNNDKGSLRKELITSKNFQKHMDHARVCALYLVFDLEVSRREYQYLNSLSGGKHYDPSKGLSVFELKDKSRYLENLSKDWPEYLKGLTRIYEILASAKEKCTFPKPIKDPDLLQTYQDLTNPIDTIDDFIDFLIVGVKFTWFNLENTRRENEYLVEELEKRQEGD